MGKYCAICPTLYPPIFGQLRLVLDILSFILSTNIFSFVAEISKQSFCCKNFDSPKQCSGQKPSTAPQGWEESGLYISALCKGT